MMPQQQGSAYNLWSFEIGDCVRANDRGAGLLVRDRARTAGGLQVYHIQSVADAGNRIMLLEKLARTQRGSDACEECWFAKKAKLCRGTHRVAN